MARWSRSSPHSPSRRAASTTSPTPTDGGSTRRPAGACCRTGSDSSVSRARRSGELQRHGVLEVDGRRVSIDEASTLRRGQSMAFVMDTGICQAAVELAAGADLAVCESTFATADEGLARAWRHLTAADAARVARAAGVRLLVLAHFSQRYPDITPLVDEACGHLPERGGRRRPAARSRPSPRTRIQAAVLSLPELAVRRRPQGHRARRRLPLRYTTAGRTSPSMARTGRPGTPRPPRAGTPPASHLR